MAPRGVDPLPATALVTATGLVKTYRHNGERVRALRGVSLEVADRELVAIMGPSGSGKSTLLQLLGGLDVADAGTITVGTASLESMTDDELSALRRRHVGFVFQFFNLIPTLTVAENVALPLMLDGRRGGSVRDRVDELLGRVGLAHRAGHTPDRLSGGEMQRVAVARALVARPSVILADEPTGNLDSAAGGDVLRLLRESADAECAVIMVTHDAGAARHADRVVTLVDGSIADGAS